MVQNQSGSTKSRPLFNACLFLFLINTVSGVPQQIFIPGLNIASNHKQQAQFPKNKINEKIDTAKDKKLAVNENPSPYVLNENQLKHCVNFFN